MKTPQRPAVGFPLNHKDARYRSNFRTPAYAARIKKRKAERQALLRDHASAQQREFRKHFSKTDLKEAAQIVNRLREEYHASNLKLGADGAKWDANKVSFQNRIRRRLSKSLPQLRPWRKKARELADRFKNQALLLSSASNAQATSRLTLGPMDPEPWDSVWVAFAPPYSVTDVVQSDYEAFSTTNNQSFAVPSIGHIINNILYEHDDSTDPISGALGLYLPLWSWSRSGVGGDFTMPFEGKVMIKFQLKNFITRGRLALTDNFGFSDGSIDAYAKLFVEIINGREITTVSKNIVHQEIDSDGSDASKLFPSLFQGGTYYWITRVEAVFPAGAAIKFAAGTEFEVFAALDDMKAHVDAVIWSHVMNIEVRAVPI